jgi:dTMP kinase
VLITFEGIDGSGKSTQIKHLKSHLEEENIAVQTFREPGGTKISEKIRDLLLESTHDLDSITELFLFSAARSQLMKEQVIPLLEDDIVVLLDRFFDSTTAYQGYGREELQLEDIKRINQLASHRIDPDLTFYLKLGLQEARQRSDRMNPDRMEQSDDIFYRRVIDGFNQLARQNERFITLDATLPEDEVARQVKEKVKERL